MARLRTRLLLLTLLAGGSTDCLLDTGPINMPPTVKIDDLNQSLHRGDKVNFAATIHDPDQSNDSLDVTWSLGTDVDCDPLATNEPGTCASQQSNDQCSYTPQASGSLCVVVRVKDRYGATASDSRVFAVEDRPPVAVIDRISPAPSTATTLPLFSNLTFSAANSTDPDPGDADSLVFQWTITPPNGASLPADTCGSAQWTTGDCSFQAATPGVYHVQLRAEDSSGVASLAPATVDVTIDQDQPPCIVGFTPTSLQTIAFADQSNSFVVTKVDDDGDPYPGSKLGTFTWWSRSGTSGAFGRLPTAQSNQLIFDKGVFVAGESIQIRVGYQDRMNRSFSPCDQDAERCELVPGSGCAQWVTWTVDFK